MLRPHLHLQAAASPRQVELADEADPPTGLPHAAVEAAAARAQRPARLPSRRLVPAARSAPRQLVAVVAEDLEVPLPSEEQDLLGTLQEFGCVVDSKHRVPTCMRDTSNGAPS